MTQIAWHARGALAAGLLAALGACARERAKPLASGDSAKADAAHPNVAQVGPLPAGTASASLPSRAQKSAGVCRAVPEGGLAIAIRGSSRDVRIGAAGRKALVTWLEPPNDEGGGRRTMGRLYDDETQSLGPERVVTKTDYGDEIPSGAVPLAIGGVLSTVWCENSAPAGMLTCERSTGDAKPVQLWRHNFGNFGPQEPAVAAVAQGDDIAIFLPEGGGKDIALFSSRVSPKRSTHQFALMDSRPFADAMAAALVGSDELAVVYRVGSTIRTRRAGFDEKWRSKALMLSTPKMQVGAPVLATRRGDPIAMFAERAKSSEPWKLTIAEWSGEEVRRRAFAVDAEAQGPALLLQGSGDGCLLVGWVAGRGERTQTRVARMCGDQIDGASTATISRADIEGGRPVFARSDKSTFVVWQEFLKGKSTELRVARIDCE